GAFEAMVKADAQRLLAAVVDGGRPSRRAPGEVKRYYLTEEAVRGEPTGMVCGGMVEVFLEVILASPVLAICGGGPVGQALARAPAPAGLVLLVAADREAFPRPDVVS